VDSFLGNIPLTGNPVDRKNTIDKLEQTFHVNNIITYLHYALQLSEVRVFHVQESLDKRFNYVSVPKFSVEDLGKPKKMGKVLQWLENDEIVVFDDKNKIAMGNKKKVNNFLKTQWPKAKVQYSVKEVEKIEDWAKELAQLMTQNPEGIKENSKKINESEEEKKQTLPLEGLFFPFYAPLLSKNERKAILQAIAKTFSSESKTKRWIILGLLAGLRKLENEKREYNKQRKIVDKEIQRTEEKKDIKKKEKTKKSKKKVAKSQTQRQKKQIKNSQIEEKKGGPKSRKALS